MQIQKKQLGILVAAVLALASGAIVYLSTGPSEPAPAVQLVKVEKKKGKKASKKKHVRPGVIAIEEGEAKKKPVIGGDSEEEAKLTEAERALLAELQDAMDANSLSRVAKVVEKIQAIQREKGLDAVPVLLRSEAVEALGWFLPDSLSNLIGFMADSDPDVLEDVMSHFEDAIDDASLGDRELSGIFKSVAKVLDNEEALDALFMGIESDMRNSVAVDTYLEIMKSGSPAAKARVWESVEDFTGEDNIKSEADLKKWAADPENADDEDDDEFYGGDKDDDKDDA